LVLYMMVGGVGVVASALFVSTGGTLIGTAAGELGFMSQLKAPAR
jgi:hypothetical protein